MKLTDKEMRVLACMIEGDTDKAIAKKTGMALNTVRVHARSLFQKMGVHNRTQAAVWAWERGINAVPTERLL